MLCALFVLDFQCIKPLLCYVIFIAVRHHVVVGNEDIMFKVFRSPPFVSSDVTTCHAKRQAWDVHALCTRLVSCACHVARSPTYARRPFYVASS